MKKSTLGRSSIIAFAVMIIAIFAGNATSAYAQPCTTGFFNITDDPAQPFTPNWPINITISWSTGNVGYTINGTGALAYPGGLPQPTATSVTIGGVTANINQIGKVSLAAGCLKFSPSIDNNGCLVIMFSWYPGMIPCQ